jgi:hypothetical protein
LIINDNALRAVEDVHQALFEVAKQGIYYQRVRVPGHEQRAGPL